MARSGTENRDDRFAQIFSDLFDTVILKRREDETLAKCAAVQGSATAEEKSKTLAAALEQTIYRERALRYQHRDS